MDSLFDSHADVAVFLERRFPAARDRAALAQLAGLGGTQATWSEVLTEAIDRGRLARLVRAAADLQPADVNLQAMAEWCEQQHRSTQRAMVRKWGPPILITAAAAAAVFVVALPPAPDRPAAVTAEAVNLEVQALPKEVPAVPAAIALAAGPLSPPPVVPVAAPVAEETETEDLPAVPPSPAPPATQAVAEDPNRPRGRCRSSSRIVGYWYAGRSAPGAQGEVVTLDYTVRVRVDYPDFHNQFNARAPVTCHLVPGDRVRLTDAPLHVPGDAYWVPLTDGDLLPPEEAVAADDTGAAG